MNTPAPGLVGGERLAPLFPEADEGAGAAPRSLPGAAPGEQTRSEIKASFPELETGTPHPAPFLQIKP